MKLCLLACASLCVAQTVTIKTGTLIDGKGGVQRNVVVSVEGSKIARIEPAGRAKSTYDLSALTLMPGWIDTHAHPNTHFDKNGRFVDVWVSKTRNSVPWPGSGGYCRRKRALENSANRLWRS
jgi:adenine deaminase